jgi:hypothetical protein
MMLICVIRGIEGFGTFTLICERQAVERISIQASLAARPARITTFLSPLNFNPYEKSEYLD